MEFLPTSIAGLVRCVMQPIRDTRGYFARTFCVSDFAAHGLLPQIVQSSVSFNDRAGTLRGMHWQSAPVEEYKLVRCLHGAIYDVVVDLRPASPTFLQYQAFELHEHDMEVLHIPPGCAHGFQTLRDRTEVQYHMSHPHTPALARGCRYDDPTVGVRWPLAVSVISERDLAWPLLCDVSLMRGPLDEQHLEPAQP